MYKTIGTDQQEHGPVSTPSTIRQFTVEAMN